MFTRNALWTALAAAAAVLMSAGASAAEMKGAAYADLSYGVDNTYVKGGGADTIFANHASYWGFKGSTNANGLTAFGAFERWLSADGQDSTRSSLLGLSSIYDVPGNQVDLSRQAYAGLATQFGTVQFGQFTTAYAAAGQKLDPFRGTAASGAGYGTGGVSHGQSRLSADQVAFGAVPNNSLILPANYAPVEGGIAGNQVAYTSPTMFGLTANVAVMFDEGSGASARQEDYAAGLEWSGMGITGGVQYLDANSTVGNTGLLKGQEAYRVYAGFSAQNFGANVSAERLDYNGATVTTLSGVGTPTPFTQGTANADFIQANGWFGVMPNCRIAASYGTENESGAEGNSFRVGVFHDVLENFTLNVTYTNFDGKVENGGAQDNADAQIISMGAAYRFEIGASTTTR